MPYKFKCRDCKEFMYEKKRVPDINTNYKCPNCQTSNWIDSSWKGIEIATEDEFDAQSVAVRVEKPIITLDSNKTENSSKKMENSIETPNDYPMMAFISKFFDFLAIINIVIGIIVFVVQASDGDLWFGLVALALSAISYGVCKLLSEVAKILSDIANNVKLIQINSESWKK